MKDPLAGDLAARAAEGVSALWSLRAMFAAALADALMPGVVTAAHARRMAVGARGAVQEISGA